MTRVLLVALVGCLGLWAVPATAQERPTAPYGYLVYYVQADGKPFPSGAKHRFVGVTTQWSTRTEWVDKINSIHRYHAKVLELKNKAEYDQAKELVRKQIEEREQGGQGPPAAKVPSVANTKWEGVKGYLTLKANGQFLFDRKTGGFLDKGLGTWEQNGNKLTLRYTPSTAESRARLVENYTIDGKKMSDGSRVMNRVE